MKVIKEFQGVREGAVYPSTIEVGSECPPELEEAGIELGCVEIEGDEKPGRKAKGAAPENKSE